MRCQEFESLLELDGLRSLSPTAQQHLSECDSCQAFFADLNLIVESAHALPTELNVPDRVWVSLHAQLEAENVIREPVAPASQDTLPFWTNIGSLFRPRTIAVAGVGAALALAGVLVLHKPSVNPPVGPQIQVASVVPPADKSGRTGSLPEAGEPTASPVKKPVATATANAETAAESSHTATPIEKTPKLRPAPSEELFLASSAALNQAENDFSASSFGNPAVDAELRKDLKTVNEFIAECEKYLKKHPKDQLAREYLNNAYRQKAELLAAMVDSGRSEQ